MTDSGGTDDVVAYAQRGEPAAQPEAGRPGFIATDDFAGLGLLLLDSLEEGVWFHRLGRLRLGTVEHPHDDDRDGVNIEGQLDLLVGG